MSKLVGNLFSFVQKPLVKRLLYCQYVYSHLHSFTLVLINLKSERLNQEATCPGAQLETQSFQGVMAGFSALLFQLTMAVYGWNELTMQPCLSGAVDVLL